MSVLEEIAAERQRQVEQEGWSAEHDDDHNDGSLARAAACYAAHVGLGHDTASPYPPFSPPTWGPHARLWPVDWNLRWWKPKNPRRDLVRAAALIVAEIERLDRKAAR